MKKHVIALVGVIALALVAGGAIAFAGLPSIGHSPTGNLVKNAFQLSTGSSLEVIKTQNEGSLTKVTLRKKGGNQVFDTYVTNDGKYIVQNPIDLDNYTKTLQARNTFISCLSDQHAQFYGIISSSNKQLAQHTRMAQLQIQVLGGSTGLQNIFQGPGTTGFPQQRVLQNGIVWRLNGELSNGIKTVPQLENATGCQYNAPGA